MRKLTLLMFLVTLPTAALAETPKGTIPVVTLEQTTTATPKVATKAPAPQKPVAKKVKTVTAPTAVAPTPAATVVAAKTSVKKTKVAKVAKPKTAKVKKEKTVKTSLKEKTLSSSSAKTHELKGHVTLGFAGTAFLDFGSEEGMYLSAADKAAIVAAGGTVQNVTAGGVGGNLNVEYGFSNRWSGTLSMGFDRLTYANRFKSAVNENFFAVDATANYYLMKNPKNILPYVSAGLGLVAGSTKTLPTLDIGGGAHFFVSDRVSIKAQVLAKAAFIFNRLQPSVGLSYHFK